MSSNRFSRPRSLVIFGHSFVRRLFQRMAKQGRANFDFPLQQAIVGYTFKGGLNMFHKKVFSSKLHEALYDHDPLPHTMILEIGSNELCDISVRPQYLAIEIYELCHQILASGVAHVFVCQILKRSAIPPGNPYYNECVEATNSRLQILFDGEPHITFWIHQKLFYSPQFNDWLVDGVHFDVRVYNNPGMSRYLQSIKTALMRANRL